MGLVKLTTRNKTRALLNDLTEGFWTNSQLDGWIDDAAIDISTLTFCYEQSVVVTLLTGIQLYTVNVDCLKVLGVIYANVGLKSATPWMEGIQTAVSTGPPKYFFEIIQQLGVFPIPTVTENSTTLTVYYAKVTDNIQNIPLKFQTAAVLFTASMALIKDSQYSKAGQLYQLYLQLLNVDKVTVEDPTTKTPPAQSEYVLKLTERK